MKTKANIQTRWLLRRDLPEILDIERHSFEYVWDEDDFLCVLRKRNAIGFVAEVHGEVAGFIIYELHDNQLRILNLAVHQGHRRQGVAAALVKRLKDKLSQQRRKRIVLETRESNLTSQKFFQSQGFRAYAVLRGFYEDCPEDAYSFRYTLSLQDDIYSPFSPANRISE